jgi:hypothetical protein
MTSGSADSSNRVVLAFCPDCGTPIYSAVPGSVCARVASEDSDRRAMVGGLKPSLAK